MINKILCWNKQYTRGVLRTLSEICDEVFLRFVRSSRQWCSIKRSVIRNFTKFTGKHLCQGLFFHRPATLLKKRPWHRCFSVNFAKFLENTSGRLLLVSLTIFAKNLHDGCLTGSQIQ